MCVCVCVCVCNGPAHMLIRMNSGKVMAIQHPSLYLSVTLSVFLSFCFTPDTKSKANGFFFFFFIFFFFLGFFFLATLLAAMTLPLHAYRCPSCGLLMIYSHLIKQLAFSALCCVIAPKMQATHLPMVVNHLPSLLINIIVLRCTANISSDLHINSNDW